MRLVYMGAPRGGEDVCGLWEWTLGAEETPTEVVIGEFTGCTGAILAEYDENNSATHILAVHCQCNAGRHALGAVKKFVQESTVNRSIKGVVIGSYGYNVEREAINTWFRLFSKIRNVKQPVIVNAGGQIQSGGIPDRIPQMIGFRIPDGAILRDYIMQFGRERDTITLSGRVFENITDHSEQEHSDLDTLLRLDAPRPQTGLSPGVLASTRPHTQKRKKPIASSQQIAWARQELKKFEERVRQYFIEHPLQTVSPKTHEQQERELRKQQGMELLRRGTVLANEYLARTDRWHGKKQMRDKLYATIDLCNFILNEIDHGNDDDVILNTVDLDRRYNEWSSGIFTSRCAQFASQVFSWAQSRSRPLIF